MPAGDIEYFLSSSLECFNITNDVYTYLMDLCENPSEIIDKLDDVPHSLIERGLTPKLIEMGLGCEEAFLDWRSQTDIKEFPIFCSAKTGRYLPKNIYRFAGDIADQLIEDKQITFNKKAIDISRKEYNIDKRISMFKRSAKRAVYDLKHCDVIDIIKIEREIQGEINKTKEEAKEKLRQAIIRHDTIQTSNGQTHIYSCNSTASISITNTILTTIPFINACTGSWVATSSSTNSMFWNTVPQPLSEKEKKRLVLQEIKRKQERRKVIKRSLKFLSMLLGSEPVRLFIAAKKLRIEGKKAIYEFTRKDLTTSHGGAQLSIYCKKTNVFLCDICIYTPKTPMADHVANIIMHIQAGEEDEILRIGNCFNVQAVAKTKKWLVPYLSKHHLMDIGVIIPGEYISTVDVSRYFSQKEMLKRSILKYILNEIDDFDDLHKINNTLKRHPEPSLFQMSLAEVGFTERHLQVVENNLPQLMHV